MSSFSAHPQKVQLKAVAPRVRMRTLSELLTERIAVFEFQEIETRLSRRAMYCSYVSKLENVFRHLQHCWKAWIV